MERQFTLLDGRGTLTVREEGARALVQAELPEDGRGLYKAHLCGGPGGRFLLGTLIPERGALRLRRTLSVDELKRRGVWPPAGAAAELAFAAGERPPAGWSREPNPARLLGEPLLRRSAGKLRGALLSREEDGFSLAFPWRTGEEFPMPALFRFARLERLEGREYAVFSFSGKGCPRMCT